jgi:hypothetical protein
MATVVLEHVHESDSNVYRVTIGTERWEKQTVDGEEKDVLVGYDGAEDFVFADDDERWKGKSRAEIVAEQRQIIAEQLASRTRPRRHRKMPTPLPGAGEEL